MRYKILILTFLSIAIIVVASLMPKPCKTMDEAKQAFTQAGYYCQTDSTNTNNLGGGFMVSREPMTTAEVIMARVNRPSGAVWVDTCSWQTAPDMTYGKYNFLGDLELAQEIAELLR